jgi:predicted transcriptional regulator YdeE
MKKEVLHLPELILVGITARTNNKNEAVPETAKISPTVQRYFHQALADKISHRAKPSTTCCVYTDYESDEFGDYTYFIGELVDKADRVPEGFSKIVIPAQKYVKFTNCPGPMPTVCVEAWKEIWQMSSTDFDGSRAYLADFEVYDERARDHNNVELDIYVGIQ